MTPEALAAALGATHYPNVTVEDVIRWKQTVCDVCEKPFLTYADWDARHTCGFDVHEDCCKECAS